MTDFPQPRILTRRTVTRGLSWTAPAVAVSTAAPAAAGSTVACDHTAAWAEYLLMRGIEMDPATGTLRLYEYNSGAFAMESFLRVLYLDGTEAFDSVYLEPQTDPEGNTEGILELETGRTDSTAFDIQSVTYTFTGGVSPEFSSRSEATLDQATCAVKENRAPVIRE